MKITKSILKKIIREEILKEMMDNNRLAQIRKAISNPRGGEYRHYLRPYDQVITRNELEYIIHHGALDLFHFRGSSFSRGNLSGLDLSGGDFNYANFSDANLKNTNLKGASLYEANFKNAKLQGADLSDTSLTYCNLSGANLTGANLTRASGHELDLKNADFTDAILFNANLSMVERNLDSVILKGAKYNDKTWIGGIISSHIHTDPNYGAVKVDNSTSDGDQ